MRPLTRRLPSAKPDCGSHSQDFSGQKVASVPCGERLEWRLESFVCVLQGRESNGPESSQPPESEATRPPAPELRPTASALPCPQTLTKLGEPRYCRNNSSRIELRQTLSWPWTCGFLTCVCRAKIKMQVRFRANLRAKRQRSLCFVLCSGESNMYKCMHSTTIVTWVLIVSTATWTFLLCYFILILQYISEANIALFTALTCVWQV